MPTAPACPHSPGYAAVLERNKHRAIAFSKEWPRAGRGSRVRSLRLWDLSEGVRSPAMARSIAKLIVPEEKNSSAPYFTDAARELIFATIRALNHVAPGRWSRALPDRSIHQHQHGGWLGGLHHVLELPGLRVRFLELGGDCGDGFQKGEYRGTLPARWPVAQNPSGLHERDRPSASAGPPRTGRRSRLVRFRFWKPELILKKRHDVAHGVDFAVKRILLTILH